MTKEALIRQHGTFKAMDEYAKEMSIAFGEWLNNNYESSVRSGIWYGFKKGTSEIEGEYTTETLHEIFLKTKQL